MTDNALVNQEGKQEKLQTRPERQGTFYTPRFDVYENENAFVLHGDLPGVKAEDVDVQFERGSLTVRGKCEPRHEGKSFLGREYGVGDFTRSFTVREEIDADKIEAELKNGVLTLTLPKSEAVKPKQISVKTA